MMLSLEFSLIPDADVDFQIMEQLMSDFKREAGIDVHLRRMDWSNAWSQLIAIATQGQGADVSHVGSTWVSSLMTMNAVSVTPKNLIARVGAEQAFVHSAWSSVTAEGDRNTYGIPLSTYVYIVAYRKDLLEQAGLFANTAFATPQAFEQSIQKLEALQAVENVWLMPIVASPFSDLVHMAASWIWSSGAHFIDNRGRQVVFNSPAALAGWRSFLTLLRRMPKKDYFGADQCMEAVVNCKAAAAITDVRAFVAALQNHPEEMQNIGAASLMSIPWSGGSSVVIWRHAQGYPDKFEACSKLIEFLSRKQIMRELAAKARILPSRTDALDELFPADHALHAVMLQLIAAGRSYRPIALWHRIEYQIGLELGGLVKQVMENPDVDMDSAVTATMNSLAYRLNLTLA
jgi:ABC-type glycerol-3-phosphate transport system substrate-binding protein